MKIYKSKLGLELIIPILILFGYFIYDVTIEKNWVGFSIILMTSLFIFYTFISIKYSIKNEILNVKCGFFVNQNIDINAIKKISETYNPISSPAASIDRLEIIYNKFDSILISPKHKKVFLDDLKKINPNIEINFRSKKSYS